LRPKTKNAWAAIRPHAQNVIRHRPKSSTPDFPIASLGRAPFVTAERRREQRVRLKAEPNSGFSATVPQNPDDLHLRELARLQWLRPWFANL